MARKTTAQAAPSPGPQATPSLPDQAGAPVAAAGDVGTTAPAATTPGATDSSPLAPDQGTREWVRALVLHDSIYGKCGEVREFDAALVGALKEAGYIDPHPNAVASAEL